MAVYDVGEEDFGIPGAAIESGGLLEVLDLKFLWKGGGESERWRSGRCRHDYGPSRSAEVGCQSKVSGDGEVVVNFLGPIKLGKLEGGEV